jgi:hypothetical protein
MIRHLLHLSAVLSLHLLLLFMLFRSLIHPSTHRELLLTPENTAHSLSLSLSLYFAYAILVTGAVHSLCLCPFTFLDTTFSSDFNRDLPLWRIPSLNPQI